MRDRGAAVSERDIWRMVSWEAGDVVANAAVEWCNKQPDPRRELEVLGSVVMLGGEVAVVKWLAERGMGHL